MEASDSIVKLMYVQIVVLDGSLYKIGGFLRQFLTRCQRIRLNCDQGHRQISTYLYNKHMIGWNNELTFVK